jgi:hypothetical protein
MATGRKDMAHAWPLAMIEKDCGGLVAAADSYYAGIGKNTVALETVITSKEKNSAGIYGARW